MVVRAMVLGWLDGIFTSIHERVLYPFHRLGGEGSEIMRGGKLPPPLFLLEDRAKALGVLIVDERENFAWQRNRRSRPGLGTG
jgi:hypothetical protein